MDNFETDDALEGIAIIGMACRFPGAKNPAQFWRNLSGGFDSIAQFTEEEIEACGVDASAYRQPGYIKAGGVVDDIDLFDASFFGFNPRDAEMADPQQRLFLECVWEALESAGYVAENYDGPIGVYAGSSSSAYFKYNLAHLDPSERADISVASSNSKDFLATSISYRLNLKGPSINLQTGCSTSLVAVHLACQGLMGFQCDIALAGGVTITVPQKRGYLYKGDGLGSPDGRCRTFDADAQGAVNGNGAGVVVLKRLADAIADKDHILAVIKGSAVNNDGSAKVGFAAPSVQGQAEVIAMAHAVADISAETISYVEAHGTATPLGDPIEIAALTRAFRAATSKNQFCAIGSVKTNIGHLDTAAGIAGLIKTVLSLHHKQIPPSLHFSSPNPKIDFLNSPFFVASSLTDWPDSPSPRRAGVSSFGIGGTNAHIVLEEAPPPTISGPSRSWQALVLSAKSQESLERATDQLADYLQENEEENLADVAYTLEVGRKRFRHRRALICRDRDEAVAALRSRDPKRLLMSSDDSSGRSIVFMFPGLGDHYDDMGLGLYKGEPVFHQHFDHCAELLRPHLGTDLREVLFTEGGERKAPASSGEGIDLRRLLGRGSERSNDERKLDRTETIHSALFAIEYALARQWMAWGVKPQAMIGYSVGEYVAACLAGVLDLEDALMLIARRAGLIETLPRGEMMAVPLSEREVEPHLGNRLGIAAINGPSMCVVAGLSEEIAAMEKKLLADEIPSRRLQASFAFHTKEMQPIYEEFVELASGLSFKAPTIPYISNVTGTWIRSAEATNPHYWAKHLCQTVRFGEGVAELSKAKRSVLLEVGPGNTLTSLALQQIASRDEAVIAVPSMRHAYENQEDALYLMTALEKLWLAGVDIDWEGFYAQERRKRVALPTYPFERRRYWIEPQPLDAETRQLASRSHARSDAAFEKKTDIADWFYAPSWQRTAPLAVSTPEINAAEKRRWLIFIDGVGIGERIARRLEAQGQNVFTVDIGDDFASTDDRAFSINPRAKEHYDLLIREMNEAGAIPDIIVHMWSVDYMRCRASEMDSFEAAQTMGFYSLLSLTQAIGKENLTGAVRLEVITSGNHEITGTEELHPDTATLLGACKVIPQEYSNITCRHIDLEVGSNESSENLVERIIAEFSTNPVDESVAFRGGYRWVRTFEPVSLDRASESSSRLRDRGVYLITGGMGKVGRILAKYLARTVRARLILVGRTPLPPGDSWDFWLADHDENDPVSENIRTIREAREAGGEALVLVADTADEEQMRAAIRQGAKQFGTIHGVIHAAGLISGKSVQEISPAECADHFRAKARGLYVLDKVCEEFDTDFCLLFSSSSSILGGLLFIAYSSANAFMDVYAHWHNRRSRSKWISADWDTWTDEEELLPEVSIKNKLANLRMTRGESCEAFERVIASESLAQVVVSVGDLFSRIAHWNGSADSASTKGEAQVYHPRPGLRNAYIAPTNEIEQTVAEIWQSVLGVEQVGIHDNFFELGGHSLLGTRVISRVRKAFGVDLPVRLLFDTPTIAEFTGAIIQRRAEEVDDKVLAEILAGLEAMSEEEAQIFRATGEYIEFGEGAND